MEISSLHVLIVVIIIIVLFWIYNSGCGSSERFGQDASVRASAGWLAGPAGPFGEDEIDKFARQISQMRTRNAHQAEQIGCDGACMGTEQECTSCFYHHNPSSPGYSGRPGMSIGEWINYPRQVSSPDKNIGPFYEGNPPWIQQDVIDDVQDLLREGYAAEGESKEPMCTSCMSTEEIEAYEHGQ